MDSNTSPPNRRSPRNPITIRLLLVLTAVFASTAASAGYLWRSAQGDQQQIGHFVVLTAMMPLLVMSVAYWIFRIGKHLR